MGAPVLSAKEAIDRGLVTAKQLMDPSFASYEKCLVAGELPLDCECGDCGGPALVMPALNNEAPSTGTLVCPQCWHPVFSRFLLALASTNGWGRVPRRGLGFFVSELARIGLIEELESPEDDPAGWYWSITPAAMSVLWVKERGGWEMERASVRGDYRTEDFSDCGSGLARGYWSHGKVGQWIHHRWVDSRAPWPIRGTGVFRYGSAS
jgi:hypothetical protein